MNEIESMTHCEQIRSRIDEYLDQELDGAEAARLELHAGLCPACAEELALARRVQQGLRSLPALACPEPVRAAVLDRARRETAQRRRAGTGILGLCRSAAAGLRRRAALLRPAPALAALLLAALLGAWIAERPAPPEIYSAEQVARAEAEVRWALAYVAEVNRRTGEKLREEVFEKRVIEPVTRVEHHL
jgi:anti-sigma factor RsiW